MSGNAEAVPPDGTRVRVVSRGMPGVPPGIEGTVRHRSPSGHSNLERGSFWLDLGEPILWSHDVSESNGYWASPVEVEVVK